MIWKFSYVMNKTGILLIVAGPFCGRHRRLEESVWRQHFWLVGLWWAAQAWITRHIWFPKSERLAKTEK